MIRLMLATLVTGGIVAIGILCVVFIKAFAGLAIPGWATSAAGILLVILMQALVLFVTSAFSMMNARSAKTVIPKLDAPIELVAPPIIRHLAHADLTDCVHHVLALRDQNIDLPQLRDDLSDLYRFLAITALLDVKVIPQVGPRPREGT